MTTHTNTKDPGNKGAVGRFFKGVWSELKKVNWPTRQETISYVGVVLMMCLLLSILLGVFDGIFHKLISYLLQV